MTTRSWARHSTTLLARRSTRALACSGWATRAVPPSTAWPGTAIPRAFDFPRSAPGELDFSFSGLKTSLLYRIRDLGDAAEPRAADLAASYQRAIVDALVARTERALEREGLERLAIGGGVAANSALRAAVRDLAARVHVPPMELCTDNAAMIGGAARFLEPLPYPEYLGLDAAARLS